MSKNNVVPDEDALIRVLENSKSAFSEEEYARRLQWVISLSEEKLQDELSKEKSIYSLISSLLITTSFLVAAFATYLSFYLNKTISKITSTNARLTIVAGVLLALSVLLELMMITYKKNRRLESVLKTTCDFFNPQTSFEHKYSENYGRILLLNDFIHSREKTNSVLIKFERINIILLGLFILTFFACVLFFKAS